MLTLESLISIEPERFKFQGYQSPGITPSMLILPPILWLAVPEYDTECAW